MSKLEKTKTKDKPSIASVSAKCVGRRLLGGLCLYFLSEAGVRFIKQQRARAEEEEMLEAGGKENP